MALALNLNLSVERNFHERWCDQHALFSRSAPLDRVLCSKPIIGAIMLSQPYETILVDAVSRLGSDLPSVCWIIMCTRHSSTSFNKTPWHARANGRLGRHYASHDQVHFVRFTVKVFNEERTMFLVEEQST